MRVYDEARHRGTVIRRNCLADRSQRRDQADCRAVGDRLAAGDGDLKSQIHEAAASAGIREGGESNRVSRDRRHRRRQEAQVGAKGAETAVCDTGSAKTAKGAKAVGVKATKVGAAIEAEAVVATEHEVQVAAAEANVGAATAAKTGIDECATATEASVTNKAAVAEAAAGEEAAAKAGADGVRAAEGIGDLDAVAIR